METTLATILITVAATATVIGLGAIVWAIAQLKRKVSNLEVLCSGYEHQFHHSNKELKEVYRNLNDTENRIMGNLDSYSNKLEREITDVKTEFSRGLEMVHNRIDRDRDQDERILDKRFDAVYRKFYSTKAEVSESITE